MTGTRFRILVSYPSGIQICVACVYCMSPSLSVKRIPEKTVAVDALESFLCGGEGGLNMSHMIDCQVSNRIMSRPVGGCGRMAELETYEREICR